MTSPKSQPRTNFVAFKTVLRKEVQRFMRIWLQTLLPPAITMALYFVIFGNLIGSRIGTMQGYSYIQYIAPGIIMMSIITNAYQNVVSSFFGAKFQRHIEEILVSPVPLYYVLLGYVVGGMCRGIIVGVIVTCVALSFTDLKIHSYPITFAVVVITAALFATAGMINAIFARKFDDISIVPTFVLTPLTYLGGVFYSIDLLPEFWRSLSLINPILYMVNGFRFGMLGVSDIPILYAFVVAVGFCIVLGTLALILLYRGIGIRT
ncbi:MAG: ABC transporter permease [Pseudomonadota bacterium]